MSTLFQQIAALVGTRIKALSAVVDTKANQSDLVSANASIANLSAVKADQSTLSALATDVYRKAEIDNAIAAAKTQVKSELIDGAGAMLDTFKEVQDQFAQDQSGVAALTNLVSAKADQTSVDALSTRVDTIGDYDEFVTAFNAALAA